MKRAILKPNGHWVGLGEYVRSWRIIRTLPAADQLVGRWDHFAVQASDVLQDLRYGMHDRINKHLPWFNKGRKWASDWQRDCRRDAQFVHDYAQRRCVHPCNRLSTEEMQRRFKWHYTTSDGLTITLYSRRMQQHG